MRSLEEIEKSRADRQAKANAARAVQELVDLDAIDALEEQLGKPLHTMTCNAFRPGVPVRAAFREPSAPEYKRYCDLVGQAQQNGDPTARRKAQEQLAEVCWAYPAKDSPERKAMLEAFPGVLLSLAIEAAKVAELRSEAEGK